jgi:restriction system protein
MRGVLEVLNSAPEGLPAAEAISRLEQIVPVTPFEDSEYPNRPGVRRREKIVRFCTIAPVKAGWLRKERGVWSITDDGRQALIDFPDPESFGLEARRMYSHWAKSRPEAAKPDEVEDEDVLTPGTTREEAEEAAWAEITAFIDNMNPYEFQDLVAALLKAMGYHVSYVSPPGPDRGLDILAHTDPLGATGPRIKVQVKRRADRASVDGLRSFLSLLGSNDVGLFVNSGGFTSEAEREARSQESRRLTLIDTRKLQELWNEH